eukprot:SAG31_NODE_14408_length_808_cov_1.002821_1_plen_165_part_10
MYMCACCAAQRALPSSSGLFTVAIAIVVASSCAVVPSASAALTMEGVFSDRMVLSHTRPMLHGTGLPGENIAVVVAFAGGSGGRGADGETGSNHSITYQRCDAAGAFAVELPPLAAPSTVPATLTVHSHSGGTAKASNVLFGTVLLCGGQSNMVHPVAYDYNATA